MRAWRVLAAIDLKRIFDRVPASIRLDATRPRDNVWLGTTAENQRWADRRIERLLSVEAKIRFLSCEPLLSAIDLTPWLQAHEIGWVIAGGESGPHARPIHPNWVRSLRDQCRHHNVPFHFKQWGHWSPEAQGEATTKIIELLDEAGRLERLCWRPKKSSGRTLDDRTWDGYPFPREDSRHGKEAQQGLR